MITSLPAASSLKRAFPNSEIEWIVDPRFAGIVECCRSVDRVTRWATSLKPPSIEGEFDALLDLQGLWKSGWAGSRVKARSRVGYHRQREGSWLFSAQVLPDPTSFHIADQMVDVARAVGGKECNDFALQPQQDDLAKLREVLPARFVAINPGGGRASKLWPVDSWRALIEQLSPEVQAVVLGSPAESSRVAEICAGSSAVDFAGRTSIRELVALLSFARAYVGGDTGTTHLAGALNIPAIGLYGVTKPDRFCAYGQIEGAIYDPGGVRAIPVEAVYTRLMGALV